MVDQDMFHASLLDMMAAQFEVFAKIERHLGILADFADMQRIKETGEKVYEVQGYVVSATSNGDKCVYLYATHPGLQYRVCTVYEERLSDLPFTVPPTAKIWDGEAAPSREGAAKKGYMLGAPHPFKVSLLPTGGTTDAGLPVHKFNRVIGEMAQSAPSHPAPTRPTSNGPQWTEPQFGPDPFDDLPSATQDPAVKQTLAKAANGNGKRPAWQDPEDHAKQQVTEEAAARAAFNARHDPPSPPLTHQELDRIAAGEEKANAPAVRPFKDQGSAIQWACRFEHYRKDGKPDLPHAVGSLANIIKAIGCKEKEVDCWASAWIKHVNESVEL